MPVVRPPLRHQPHQVTPRRSFINQVPLGRKSCLNNKSCQSMCDCFAMFRQPAIVDELEFSAASVVTRPRRFEFVSPEASSCWWSFSCRGSISCRDYTVPFAVILNLAYKKMPVGRKLDICQLVAFTFPSSHRALLILLPARKD